jgi:hypothetical protein
MKIFTALLLALVATSSFATNDKPTNTGGSNTNINTNAPRQDQGQAQGQFQGQGQAQGLINANNIGVSNRISNDVRNNANAFAAAQASAKSNAQNLTTTDVRNNNGGNTLTVNEAAIPANTSVTYAGKYEVKNTPGIALGNVYPTSPCMGSSQVGGSGPGFSIGIGTSWTDDECGIRETARSFAGANLKEDALAILCTSKYAAAAPSCAKKVEPVAVTE